MDTIITLNKVLGEVCVYLSEEQLSYLVGKLVTLEPQYHLETTMSLMRALGSCSSYERPSLMVLDRLWDIVNKPEEFTSEIALVGTPLCVGSSRRLCSRAHLHDSSRKTRSSAC